ncbi:hypothetical protein J7382_11675 [Shimia sp. R11_0]|uniref:hypothetical protein n=1 Tax=Shimia sp. R11_0 TaxID=2821096 RepID=UPI001ADAAD1C|nr:hypothetical protein [Shimia sp. R11_0]MBO9478195.1 hypothetical protein [Shimia sp. R11_0]
MKIVTTLPFLAALLLPTASVSQPASISEFVGLSKADFLAEMETIHETAWPDLAVMFTRLDPAFEDMLPPYDDWDAQTKELAGCVYDTMAETGALDKLAEYTLLQTEYARFLSENPELDFSNMGENEEVQERFGTPSTEYIQASSSCGLLDHQGLQMQETGLMEALFRHMQ